MRVICSSGILGFLLFVDCKGKLIIGPFVCCTLSSHLLAAYLTVFIDIADTSLYNIFIVKLKGKGK
jgi:hypothetical protein